MRRIPRNTLDEFKKKLDARSEICGIVVPGSDILELKSLDVGPHIHDGERGSCRSTNIWINFHTHPFVVYPWPSTEDVFKILYDRGSSPVLWGSLIFTEWGVWELYSPTKIPQDTLDEMFEWWTVNASDKLFFDLGLDQKKQIPQAQQVVKQIQDYLDLWNEGFGELGVEITLTFWEDIEHDYLLQTGLSEIPYP